MRVLTGRIERVDVQRQIHRVLGPDPLENLLDDAVGADLVDLARLDNLKPAVPVVLVVARPAQRGADAGVDVGVVAQQALLGRVVEVRPVVDAGDLRGRAAEDLGAPRVQVAVEVDDRDGAVGAVDGAQQRQGDGVVAAEGDDARERLAVLGWALLPGVRLGRAREDVIVPLFDLVEGVGVVVPGQC